MEKRYWLFGGNIALLINVALFAIFYFFDHKYGNSSDFTWAALGLGSLFLIPVSFLFGSFIGWLYGKTKN